MRKDLDWEVEFALIWHRRRVKEVRVLDLSGWRGRVVSLEDILVDQEGGLASATLKLNQGLPSEINLPLISAGQARALRRAYREYNRAMLIHLEAFCQKKCEEWADEAASRIGDLSFYDPESLSAGLRQLCLGLEPSTSPRRFELTKLLRDANVPKLKLSIGPYRKELPDEWIELDAQVLALLARLGYMYPAVSEGVSQSFEVGSIGDFRDHYGET